MTRPTAIYRPIERDVLLTDGEATMALLPGDANRFARELARLAQLTPDARGKARDNLELRSHGAAMLVQCGDYLHLACEIDHALAVPTIAAAMLDDARCR